LSPQHAEGLLLRQRRRCRAFVLTTSGRPGYLRRALKSGARGFVVGGAPPEQLADVIPRVAAGERVVDPQLAAATLASDDSPPTAASATCCSPPAPARPSPEIATTLFVPEGRAVAGARPHARAGVRAHAMSRSTPAAEPARRLSDDPGRGSTDGESPPRCRNVAFGTRVGLLP
jgi:hypothetical protein